MVVLYKKVKYRKKEVKRLTAVFNNVSAYGQNLQETFQMPNMHIKYCKGGDDMLQNPKPCGIANRVALMLLSILSSSTIPLYCSI